MLSGEAENTNVIVLGLSRPALKTMIYGTWDEHSLSRPALKPTIYGTWDEHSLSRPALKPTIYGTWDEHNLYRPELKPTMYGTWDEHTNYYTTDADFIIYDNNFIAKQETLTGCANYNK